MRTINEGDKVLVSMSRNDLFPFQESCTFIAIVKSSPQDTGDCWYLELLDGSEITVNPNSSDFVGMVKVKP